MFSLPNLGIKLLFSIKNKIHKNYLFPSSICDKKHIICDGEAASTVGHYHKCSVKRARRVARRHCLLVNSVHCQDYHCRLRKMKKYSIYFKLNQLIY